jgi:hypothetical protein
MIPAPGAAQVLGDDVSADCTARTDVVDIIAALADP